MKRILGGLALLVAAFLSKEAFATGSAQDWSGLYVGVNAGGGLADGQFTDDCYYCATDDFSRPFATLGGQIGYNWAVGSGIVGVEGDFNWTSFNRKGLLGGDDS